MKTIVIAALAAVAAAGFAAAAAAASGATFQAGRWLLFHGSPRMAYQTILLDTATGSTWIRCQLERGADAWCVMPLTQATSTSDPRPTEPTTADEPSGR